MLVHSSNSQSDYTPKTLLSKKKMTGATNELKVKRQFIQVKYPMKEQIIRFDDKSMFKSLKGDKSLLQRNSSSKPSSAFS